MKPAIPKSVVYSVVLLLVLLAVNAGVSWYYTRMLHDRVGIADSYEILDALSDSLLLVLEAETGQRSYILTGDPAFLEHYQSAFSSRAELLGRLIGYVVKDSRKSAPVRIAAAHVVDPV